MAMVQQAIQNGGRLVAQHCSLVADGLVRLDQVASSFVAATDQLEGMDARRQEIGAGIRIVPLSVV